MSGCSSTATEETSTKATINDIFRLYGPAYLEKYGEKMPQDQIKAIMAMIHCRSPEAGTILYRCSNCGMEHQVPKACGNRNCPSCQGSKARAWLEKQIDQLLPCAYFMITFTVPAEFRSFVRSHPKECYKALFDAAYKTLVKLAKDPKYVGSSKLGVTGVLHTWGRDMSYHPHVHFIVPGGAISEDGTSWLPSRSDFFIPVQAASIIFRAKYRAEMKRGGLLDQISDEVWSKAWIVNSQAVGDGRLSLKYLSPYVFRIAIGNHRIVSVTPGEDGQGEVVFLVKRTGTNQYRPMTVTAEEFIRRYLGSASRGVRLGIRDAMLVSFRLPFGCELRPAIVPLAWNLAESNRRHCPSGSNQIVRIDRATLLGYLESQCCIPRHRFGSGILISA
jgi:hypothetical protein